MGKSSTTNEVDDLDLVAFADDGGVEGDSLEDDEIVLEGHRTGVDVEPGEQLNHSQRRRHVEPRAVQRDRQRCVWPWPPPPARPQLEGCEAPFYRRCYDQRMPLDREAVLAWYRRNRERSRALFDLVSDDAYYRQPIALRHPIVFYEGHLPACSFNTLVKKSNGRSSGSACPRGAPRSASTEARFASAGTTSFPRVRRTWRRSRSSVTTSPTRAFSSSSRRADIRTNGGGARRTGTG